MFRFFIKKLFPTHTIQQYNTVRYTFSFVLACTIFACIATVVAQNVSYITIHTPKNTVVKDQIFSIDVTAFAHTPINAINITLTYPKDFLVIDNIDTGNSVITLWTKDPYAEDGKIYLQGGTFRRGFLGEHTIARIRAHAIKAGDAHVVLHSTQLVAGDGNGTVINTKDTKNNSLSFTILGTNDILTVEAEIGIITDIDGDGKIDFDDISEFMIAWITRGHTFDFNADGYMTFKDFSIILADSFIR